MAQQKAGPSVVTSPDYDAYAGGQIAAHEAHCLMCGQAPCSGVHPEFGSPEYLRRLSELHGK